LSQCPEFEESFEIDEDAFNRYSESMFNRFLLTRSKEEKRNFGGGGFIAAWWDLKAFTITRRFIFDLDFKSYENNAAAQAKKKKRKLDSENEEKARLAKERKEKDEEILAVQLETNKKAVEMFGNVGRFTALMEQTLPQLVTAFSTPTSSVSTISNKNTENERLLVVENDVKHIKSSIEDILNILKSKSY
jgi:hypothetical protein